MRRARRLFALLGLLLLAAAAVEAGGVTIYVQRVLVTDPGDIRLGDLVQPHGDTPAAAGETLALNVATLSNHLLYIPSRSYMDSVVGAFGRDSIFVGSRSLVIPRGLLPDNEVPLMDKLVDFLSSSGVLANDVADIELRTVQLIGTLPANVSPSFQLVRSSRGGAVEVSYTASGDGGQASGRIILAMQGDPRSATADVRASDPVRIVFHRGPITIETQGKALGAAAVGETVNVLVTDSRKSFSGRLLAGKAVDVELP